MKIVISKKCSFCEMMIDSIKEKLHHYYKFVSQPGELKIGCTLCELCNYYSKDSKKSCEKYEEIPEELIKNKKKCEYLKMKNTPW